MQFKLATLTLALATLAAATPTRRTGEPAGDCTTGPIQCCTSTSTSADPVTAALLGLLGIVLPADVLVGLTCSPITVIGVGGGECSASPVCCSDNSNGGLISIGCVPVSL
ncbi:fungal hydrophobin-domain-containing protein [Mucidula mucida]|nr:fungal hydrophobin-domain-containing protein [Mucidula mucida]